MANLLRQFEDYTTVRSGAYLLDNEVRGARPAGDGPARRLAGAPNSLSTRILRRDDPPRYGRDTLVDIVNLTPR